MLKSIVNFFKDIFQKTGNILKSILAFFISLFILAIIIGLISAPTVKETNIATKKLFQENIIREYGGEEKIVIIPLSGMILMEGEASYISGSSQFITPDKVRSYLNQIQKDPLAKAVIFDLNSPGGSPVASDRIYEEITLFKENTHIPVLFVFSDLAASGGYYIASASDFIVANPSSLTGSIGVIMESYNLEELYNKIGVGKQTFKVGEYKDILSESRPITEAENQIIEKLNLNTYDLFVSRVASGRKLDENYVRQIANGQIYSGRQAKDLGLVDSLGNQDEAIYQAKSLAELDKFKVVEYYSYSIWNEVFNSLSISNPISLLKSAIYLPSQLWVQK